jgi:heat shock protein HslJ
MTHRIPGPTLRLAAAALVVLAAATLLAACNLTGSGLTGLTWRVTAVTTTVPAWQGVVPAADQDRYTITFANDGTAQITADCNQVGATYSTSPGGSITIVPGASTLAMCPEDSMGSQFVEALSTVSTYSVDGNDLTLLQPDGSRLELSGT